MDESSKPLPTHSSVDFARMREKNKRACIALLDRCLASHCLEGNKQKALIASVTKILDLASPSSSAAYGKDDDEAEGGGSSKKKKRTTDEHNEVCEVCEKGGELLCCETCTLVFHLQCVRPKLLAVPRGKWSCSHCILDGVVRASDSAIAQAKIALRAMGRISRGLESDDEGGGSGNGGSGAGDGSSGRIMRSGEITVVQSGKRFIVRKTTRTQIVELGRYDTLEQALTSLSPTAGTAEAHLWCMQCLDDPSISLCAFCGCRRCFGKHEPDLLLQCDECNEHTHTYCLKTPLTVIPEESWFCARCIRIYTESGGTLIQQSAYDAAAAAATAAANNKRRGRPQGKRSKEHAGDDAFLMSAPSQFNSYGAPPLQRAVEEAPLVIPTVDAVGVDAALLIISKMSRRELSRPEVVLLEQLRTWAPLGDLETALKALQGQRDHLNAKIAAYVEGAAAAAAAGADADVDADVDEEADDATDMPAQSSSSSSSSSSGSGPGLAVDAPEAEGSGSETAVPMEIQHEEEAFVL